MSNLSIKELNLVVNIVTIKQQQKANFKDIWNLSMKELKLSCEYYDNNNIWKELSSENEFCDVTLVCENKQILDHKVVFDHSINKTV